MESKKVGCKEEAYKFEMKDKGTEGRPIASLTNGSVANSLPFNIYVSLPQP
jgi:hypothetical protein